MTYFFNVLFIQTQFYIRSLTLNTRLPDINEPCQPNKTKYQYLQVWRHIIHSPSSFKYRLLCCIVHGHITFRIYTWTSDVRNIPIRMSGGIWWWTPELWMIVLLLDFDQIVLYVCVCVQYGDLMLLKFFSCFYICFIFRKKIFASAIRIKHSLYEELSWIMFVTSGHRTIYTWTYVPGT